VAPITANPVCVASRLFDVPKSDVQPNPFPVDRLGSRDEEEPVARQHDQTWSALELASGEAYDVLAFVKRERQSVQLSFCLCALFICEVAPGDVLERERTTIRTCRLARPVCVRMCRRRHVGWDATLPHHDTRPNQKTIGSPTQKTAATKPATWCTMSSPLPVPSQAR
jgi:hypothetical protein